jgi:hypothetical protein
LFLDRWVSGSERLRHVETRMNKGVRGRQRVIGNRSKWKRGIMLR